MSYPKSEDAFWRFETARFSVEFHALPEDLDPADSFDFPEAVEFASSGDPAAWFCACVLVRDVETGEVLGRDILGGCSYNSFEEFISSHRDADPANRNTLALKAQNTVICHYFPDMVAEAITDARKTLAAQRQRAAAVHA